MTASVKLGLPARPQIRSTNFRIARRQAFNYLRSGDHQVVEMGEPLWVCDIESTELSKAIAGQYKWRFAQLRGLGTFYLWDAERPRPLAYLSAAAGSHPWGSPVITAVDQANSCVALSGLTAGAVISEGDYGHWDDGPTRRLHICGAAVADGSGVIAALPVEPAPPPSTVGSLPLAFTMENAAAEFSIAGAKTPFEAPALSRVTFSGVQAIRRTS